MERNWLDVGTGHRMRKFYEPQEESQAERDLPLAHTLRLGRETTIFVQEDPLEALYSEVVDIVKVHAELCSVCKYTLAGFRNWRSSRTNIRGLHHASIADLRLASQRKCPVCQWVTDSLSEKCASDAAVDELVEALAMGSDRLTIVWVSGVRKGWYAANTEPSEFDTTATNQMLFAIHVELDGESLDIEKEVILASRSFRVDMVDPDAEKPDRTIEPGTYTGSRETLDLTKHWLEQCKNLHVACQAMRIKSWQPARLLHWTRSDTSWKSLALCEAKSGDYDSDVRYMTVSHRWTTGQMLLQRSNTQDLRRSVEYGKLKMSVRDALAIASHLGYEYLWVDSLCIRQDDAEDCAQQVMEMDKVYSNSACNIAASDASSNDQGCFFYRDWALLQSYYVRLDGSSSCEARHQLSITDADLDGGLDDSVLAQRAWVFQERMLAPRTIHFCKTQVYWECREMDASETRPMGGTREAGVTHVHVDYSLRPSSIFQWNERKFAHGNKRDEGLWHLIVAWYSNRSLSFPGDRLRALAGISGLWQRMRNDEYLFGLWRNAMPWDLLWYSSGRGKRLREQALAPSWSWASVDCEPWFAHIPDLDARRYLALLLDTIPRTEDGGSETHADADVESLSPKPWTTFGPTTEDCVSRNSALLGSLHDRLVLRLQACIVRLAWFEILDDEDSNGPISKFKLPQEIQSRKSYAATFLSNDVDILNKNEIWFDDEAEKGPETLHCLPIYRDTGMYGEGTGKERIIGLVIKPLDNHNGRYERIGYFDTRRSQFVTTFIGPVQAIIELA
ncbi:hypothetical protein LTR97_010559 [Elasticomyces elasticus]|uniref:Heterokaryon incompatibility domain-containing protein n=1 Tax=Elasticomyces elasticus TaxID=574655 RepID=A0AAN7W3T3_9PEZI|nr:hypothetical protein LTR97_010559 [Elasticomyces elasticus]